MSRTPLDTWSKREQLCLASAVSCSGDQNWITVSRTLKSVCGNGNTRPADWYSQKNCAVQYGHLLETVETTKRKKRTNESSAGFSSPATVAVETPTEILLRRLTEERLLEIKAQMRRDQELYSQVQREIESLQSDMMSELQLQQMWQEIEKEQETKRIDEMKLENRMREREQRKKDVAGNWRNNNSNNANGRRSNMTADTTSVDMDVEDIAGITAASGNNKHQAAPAPLLTSLLKSPGSGGGNNANSVTSPTATTPTTPGIGSVARATAPTITSLLTSGAGAIPNQPAIVMKSPSDTAFMTRPISGPPLPEVATTGRSPSQAAPTLSMLLEKNKMAAAVGKANESTRTTDTEISPSQKQPAAELEPTSAETADAVDESDAEEQQLLEVFKNMDDIMDDIDIDMASVIDEEILKDVSNVDSPPSTSNKTEVVDFEDKLDALKREQGESRKSSKSPTVPKAPEVVIGSSDDSNDNIPLATVASQESKDRSQPTADNITTATAPMTHEEVMDELSETITIGSSSSEDNPQEIHSDMVGVKVEPVEAIKSPMSETAKQPEVSNPNPDADANTDKQETVAEAPKEDTTRARTTETDKAATEPITEQRTLNAPAAGSSVHDTDEESSSVTDSIKPDEPGRGTKPKQQSEHKSEADSGTVPRQTPTSSSNLTPAPAPVAARAPLLRKLPHRDRSESPMVDDDTTTASDHSTARSSTRRRCSSTPVIDSIPNSPASSEHTDDRRETRAASKKLFLSIYSTLLESKYAAPFRRPFHDEHSHADLCLRPMDLPTIKRNIDSGHLRNISELYRDVLLMCHNLLLVYKPQSTPHKTARLFLQECQAVKEFATIPHSQSDNSTSTTNVSGKTEKERTPAGNKARSGSRKSQRHH
ncbi:bromodomain-containing protein 8 [Drosophila innubila]|uniref:bromodomain-containing protein 8 n=1 Tax=Drosophila innubila TaxID=198719 RepID=UPI00148BB874|nr:bromodomain-containing protein 8 [Drosophila innubila]